MRRYQRTVPLPQRKRGGLEREAIRLYLESLGTARALSVWLLYESKQFDQSVTQSLNPHDYIDSSVVRSVSPCGADRFRRDYAATKLLSKCQGLETGIDTVAVALQGWRAAEDLNRLTNKRIKSLREGSASCPGTSVIFHDARRKIASILGPLSLGLFRDVGWSKGRTSSAYGFGLDSVEKYTSRLDVTWRARKYALSLLRSSPRWGQSALKADGPCSVLPSALSVVEGNTLITVPKNAKTDRVICYEPHLNIRLQLAVGDYIRRALRRTGVDLSDQTINQARARIGSITGGLSTIDLKSASDMLCTELVYELLPIEWAMLLDDLRSPYTKLPDGTQHRNEKFSSMGNGYTFELESLIFYALCASISSDVSVFGDDLVVPTACVKQVRESLVASGFVPNETKSFSTSPFRESCGHDYFGGLLVSPPYLRTRISRYGDLVTFWNRVYETSFQRGWMDMTLEPLYQLVRSCGMPLGPMGYGDGHINACWDSATPQRCGDGWDAWFYTTYLSLPRKYRPEIEPELESAALCAATDPKALRIGEQGVQFTTRKTRLTACAWPSVMWI